MQGIDPTTGEAGRRYERHDAPAIEVRLEKAQRGFEAWSRSPMDDRVSVLRAAAKRLRERGPELAELMAREMGKPVVQGRGEAGKCAIACEHYADHGPRISRASRRRPRRARAS